MWRALKFCVIAAVILALAWWVAALPGDVTANAGTYRITTSAPVALLLILVVVAVLLMLLRVLGGLRRAPGRFSGWRGGPRRASLPYSAGWWPWRRGMQPARARPPGKRARCWAIPPSRNG
jgi:HemY protein